MFGLGCGIRLYRLLIIAFLSTLNKNGLTNSDRDKLTRAFAILDSFEEQMCNVKPLT